MYKCNILVLNWFPCVVMIENLNISNNSSMNMRISIRLVEVFDYRWWYLIIGFMMITNFKICLLMIKGQRDLRDQFFGLQLFLVFLGIQCCCGDFIALGSETERIGWKYEISGFSKMCEDFWKGVVDEGYFCCCVEKCLIWEICDLSTLVFYKIFGIMFLKVFLFDLFTVLLVSFSFFSSKNFLIVSYIRMFWY